MHLFLVYKIYVDVKALYINIVFDPSMQIHM